MEYWPFGLPPRRPRRPKVHKQIESASGYRLYLQNKGESRVSVSLIDRRGRLLHKMTFNRADWEDFTS